MTELQAEWYQQNKEKINEKNNEKNNERMENDATFKLKKAERDNIRRIILHNKTSDDTLIGCSAKEFKKWIEYCFEDGMTFDNYGKLWHIDHVIPINKFNIEDEEQAKLCFSWCNTMPMLAHKNMSKHDKIKRSQVQKQHIKLLSFITEDLSANLNSNFNMDVIDMLNNAKLNN